MSAIFSFHFPLTCHFSVTFVCLNKSLNFGVSQGLSQSSALLICTLSHSHGSHTIYMLMTFISISRQALSPELQNLTYSCKLSRQIYQEQSQTLQIQQVCLLSSAISPDHPKMDVEGIFACLKISPSPYQLSVLYIVVCVNLNLPTYPSLLSLLVTNHKFVFYICDYFCL